MKHRRTATAATAATAGAAGVVAVIAVIAVIAVMTPQAAGIADASDAPTRTAARADGGGGRISFTVPDPASEGDTFVFTTRPAGTGAAKVLPSHTCCAGWSPDGSRLVVPRLTTDDRIASATVRKDGTRYHPLPLHDSSLNIGCGTGSWSPRGGTLTCESWDDARPDRNGMYTISARDGRVVRRVTANPLGGHDIPGSYAPNGRRLVFVRFGTEEYGVGLFVVRADGHGVRRLRAAGSRLNIGADWSPHGNAILFSRHTSENSSGSLWLVHADGSGLRQIVVPGLACGSDLSDPGMVGCHAPVWSPDGTKFAFAAGTEEDGFDIYSVNLDGSGLTRVTRHGGDNPDWGPTRRAHRGAESPIPIDGPLPLA